MCGIFGVCLDEIGAKADPELLHGMMSCLAHRGPDGKGKYVNGNVALGHRRLSIIDIETGDQPIFNEDHSISIVFNGEIYNYKELRKSLLARGHTFKTTSDTEVIVHLYEDEGEKCLDFLNGMFAFAIWDSPKSRLFAARDRFGEKPFYYCERKGRFLFASELKAILKDPEIPRDIDLNSLDDYLTYGYIPAPRTIYKGIKKLCAAESLVWKNGKIKRQPYWKGEFPVEAQGNEDEYVEKLRELLNDSIRLRLRSDVPVGAFLSGGVDSNGIVALASTHVDKPLQTFSVGFSESDFDELAYARLTAKRYNTDHHEIVVSDASVDVLGNLVAHFDEPLGDPSILPTYFIAREASRFVKVCISGDAGDEVFGGYTRYLSAIHYSKADSIPQGIRKFVFGNIADRLPDFVIGKGLTERLSVSGADRYQRMVGIFNETERHNLINSNIAEYVSKDSRLFERYFSKSKGDLLSTLQLIDQNTYLPENILVKVDRASMKNSLEVRVPFLDHRLVELVNAMPPDMKIRGKTQKYILKKALKDIVSQKILAAPKKGFGIPIKNWFRGELQTYAREMLLSSSSKTREFLKPSSVENLLRSHDQGGRDLSDRIWLLLVLEQWYRNV